MRTCVMSQMCPWLGPALKLVTMAAVHSLPVILAHMLTWLYHRNITINKENSVNGLLCTQLLIAHSSCPWRYRQTYQHLYNSQQCTQRNKKQKTKQQYNFHAVKGAFTHANVINTTVCGCRQTARVIWMYFCSSTTEHLWLLCNTNTL